MQRKTQREFWLPLFFFFGKNPILHNAALNYIYWLSPQINLSPPFSPPSIITSLTSHSTLLENFSPVLQLCTAITLHFSIFYRTKHKYSNVHSDISLNQFKNIFWRLPVPKLEAERIHGSIIFCNSLAWQNDLHKMKEKKKKPTNICISVTQLFWAVRSTSDAHKHRGCSIKC